MNKGRIRISGQLYHGNYDLVKPIFELVKPIKIDIEYWAQDDVVIWGESLLFDKVAEGSEIPFYDCTIDKEKGVLLDKING